MDILFLIDRIELKYFEFNNLVTNFWLIRELMREGSNVFITTIDKLGISGGKAFAHCYPVFEKLGNILYERTETKRNIEEFRLCMLRNDPPVDLDYINATYIFDFVDRSKTIVMNEPRAVRDFNEKLHAMLFPDLMPEHMVTSSKSVEQMFWRRRYDAQKRRQKHRCNHKFNDKQRLNPCYGAEIY